MMNKERSTSKQGPFYESRRDTKRAPRKKRRGLKWVLGSAAAVVILALVIAGGYLYTLQNSYSDNVSHFPAANPEATGPGADPVNPPEEDRPEEEGSTNILLIGSDAHGGSGETEELFRVPGGERSDTMMLVNIPESGDSLQVISLPRDTWVDIPYGYGWHKINAGLTLGGGEGPWLTVATVEDILDVRIDHVASIDMLGFTNLVDDMGGVDVNSSFDQPFTTAQGYTFTPGMQQMNSEEALSFVRHRQSFPDGDLQRIRNQQAFIRAVVDQAATPSTLANPLRVQDMVATFSSHMRTDDSLTATKAAELAWSARSAASDINFMTLPNAGSGYSDDGQWIFYQDPEANAEVSQALKDGTLDEYIAEQ